MGEIEKLSLSEISDLVTGSTDHFKDEVKNNSLTLQDLNSLKEAEEAGKNREAVLKFLDRQKKSKNISRQLGTAETDLEQLEKILDEVNRIEDLEHFHNENIDIDQDKLIDLVGGTVEELKKFVNESPLDSRQLEDVLNAEKRVKDRKTAKKYLQKQIKKRRVGQDVSNAREDLENLKSDIEELEKDESVEADPSSNQDLDETTEVSEKHDEDGSQGAKKEEHETEKPQENDSPEDEKNEKDSEEENKESEDPGDPEEPREAEDSELDKKIEIAENLGLEMSDEELENFSLEDLEKIEAEKSQREDLIQFLAEEGLDEGDLRDSSTSDLEKLKESMSPDEETQEEHEEMREEAEEDLEMLMGAVRWDEEPEDGEPDKNTKEKLHDLKQRIKDKLDRSSDKDSESSTGINPENAREILENYRELGDEEASIKTAHIMKGFLEQSLGVEREMTYKEIADTMPTEDESMKELSEFFQKMHREQYTGKLDVDKADKIIDTCEEVINRLS